jgi:hypothetical protein
MQDPVSHRQSNISGIPTNLNVPLGRPHKAPAKAERAARDGSSKSKSRRIIVRVPDELYQALMVRSCDLGRNLSHVVRSALVGCLMPETVPNAPRKPLLRPEDIDPLASAAALIRLSLC